MPKWPIRVKLIAGLTLVVGMMLILMGGSIFGLHSFHSSNLTLVDQLRELGASKDLLQFVFRLEIPRTGSPQDRRVLEGRVKDARQALYAYHTELRKNTTRGNRADDGRDELGLAFQIDCDLTEILAELEPGTAVRPMLPGTSVYLARHPENRQAAIGRDARIERLKHRVMDLPDKLHHDFYQVLLVSQRQYQASRVIVWTSALMVLAMLIGLAALFHRWVLYPVRLLQRGVRRVARGAFDYKIELATGDEMQGLAEAFNDMTSRLSVTYADLERQVQERSRQLVRSERLAGVGFLAAGVAHEINNPLASIAFCSEALENRLGSFLDDAIEGSDAKVVRNYLRMIQEEAFRCKSITEKLLDFSRCAEIQRERTDLAGLIQGVVEMIRHMGKYRGKHIAFQPREAVMAHVDAQEIKQVVLNLIVNALESMDSRRARCGSTLRYAQGKAEMVVRRRRLRHVEPDVLENIFEPFFTRSAAKGRGRDWGSRSRIGSSASTHGEINRPVSPGPKARARHSPFGCPSIRPRSTATGRAGRRASIVDGPSRYKSA